MSPAKQTTTKNVFNVLLLRRHSGKPKCSFSGNLHVPSEILRHCCSCCGYNMANKFEGRSGVEYWQSAMQIALYTFIVHKVVKTICIAWWQSSYGWYLVGYWSVRGRWYRRTTYSIAYNKQQYCHWTPSNESVSTGQLEISLFQW